MSSNGNGDTGDEEMRQVRENDGDDGKKNIEACACCFLLLSSLEGSGVKKAFLGVTETPWGL